MRRFADEFLHITHTSEASIIVSNRTKTYYSFLLRISNCDKEIMFVIENPLEAAILLIFEIKKITICLSIAVIR